MSRVVLWGLVLLFIPTPLYANMSIIPGHALGLGWVVPFLGMLLSLAILPLVSIRFWEAHYGKVAYMWALITAVSLSVAFGWSLMHQAVIGMLLHHYLPFIIMMGTLYTIAGGIHITVRSPATPFMNTCFLAVGTLLAGWVGTTGAAMLLVRPFLKMNEQRKHQAYHMIFFIFLVSNVGGALTPLGDPPLFLGFLNGVGFLWTIQSLALPMLYIAVPILLIFYGVDRFVMREVEHVDIENAMPLIKVKGKTNSLLFLGVMGLVTLSGVWKSEYHLNVVGTSLELQNMVRDGGLILISLFSYHFTASSIRQINHFSWGPFQEVVKLFFGIFMTVLPVAAILDAGEHGGLAPLISLVTANGQPENGMYFWFSGILSSCLDNAPTYLVFFHMAGGDAPTLMTTLSSTLIAISLGSVFMGAMTYIGNAPNFMVKTVAESYGVKMPSFFGYMIWSCAVLLPLFAVLSWGMF